jgi:hypothetical protein
MTTSPRLGFTDLVAGQAVPETTVNEIGRRVEQGASYFVVKDKDIDDPPGGPADGDAYIVATGSPTGAWTGWGGRIAFYMNTAWESIVPIEGTRAYVQDENIDYEYTGAAWAAKTYGNAFYDIPLAYAGGPPITDEIIGALVVPRAVSLPANFAGSSGYIGTNPTGSFVITVKVNGSTIGTITVSTGGAFTFATSGGTSKSITAGQRIEFIAPTSVDATAAYILASLAGTA